MALTAKLVTGTVTIAPGVPATGTVTAQLTDWLADPTDRLVASVPITFKLDETGTIPAGSTLYATDDPGVNPTGVTYQLKIRPDRGHAEVRYVSLSRAATEPVDIVSLSDSAEAVGPVFDIVHKAGAETITGDKDFTGALMHNGVAVAADNAVVHSTGDETVMGVKTFTSAPVVPARTWNRGDQFDITDFGYVDGMLDAGPAIQAAINAAPNRVASIDGFTRPYRVTEIRIPMPDPAITDRITIATQVSIPAGKSIVFMADGGMGRASVLVEWTGAGSYAWHIVAGQRTVRWYGVMFYKGGVEIEGNTRKDIGFYNCGFQETPDYAVQTLGPSVIEVTFDHCIFAENMGDVFNAFRQSDVWTYKNCSFLTGYRENIRLRSSGQHFVDCDFEVRHGPTAQTSAGNEKYPYVWLDTGDSVNVGSSDIHFTRTRFGNEPNAPRYVFVVGPDLDEGTNEIQVSAVTLSQCQIRGTVGNTPTADSADAVIFAGSPLLGWNFVACEFFAYNYFVKEAYLASVTGGGKNYNNKVIGGDDPPNTIRMFSGGGDGEFGVGWEIAPTRLQSREGTTRGNLLKATEAMDTWTLSGVTVAKDATDPLGTANSAYTVTRTASGNASLRKTSNTTDGTPVVFSVWAKAGTANTMRLNVSTSTNHERGFYRPIRLSTSWRRYWIVVPSYESSTSLFVYILVGTETDGLSSGTISVWGPQLEYGDAPSPYLASTDSTVVHADRPHRSLSLGRTTITYGTAAPVSGRYEVGDVVINTAPSSGAPWGWTCVTAGSPGTWLVVALVDPVSTTETLQALGNTGASKTISTSGSYVTGTLTANCTFTFPSPTNGTPYNFALELTQDGTGGRTVTWPASVKWPSASVPSLSTAAGAVDLLAFTSHDGGTTWYGVLIGTGFA
jgi:hypothetical protein